MEALLKQPWVNRRVRAHPIGGLQGAALRLARFASCGMRIGFVLSAGHTQAEAFQPLAPALLTAGIALADVRGRHFWILEKATPICLPMTKAKERSVHELHGLHPAKAVTKAHQPTPACG